MGPVSQRTLHIVLLGGIGVFVLRAAMVTPPSSDLLALWLAALSLAQDMPHLVYPAGDVFDLIPPAEWAGMAAAAGAEGSVYPYLYPPLVAALLVPLTKIMSFAAFAKAVLLMNVALLLAIGWLAWRACGRIGPLPVWLAITQAIYHCTLIGFVGLYQGQPQILVAFLTLLMIERLRYGHPVAAGAALALAAALKVYPLLYVIFLLAMRQTRATAAFAVTGAALAAASIALTGWDLHLTFLAQLRAISHSAISVPVAFSFDSVIAARLPGMADLFGMTVAGSDAAQGAIHVVPKPDIWRVASKLALFTTLTGFAIAFRRTADPILLWPAAMISLALISPLGWAYHFISAVAFAPALAARWGYGPVALLFCPLITHLLSVPLLQTLLLKNLPMIGATLMILFALGCILRPASLPRMLVRHTPR